MSISSTVGKLLGENVLNNAKLYLSNTNIPTFQIALQLEGLINTLKQANLLNPLLKSFNFQPYIDKILAMIPPAEMALEQWANGTFSGANKLYALSNAAFSAGDTLGIYSKNISKIELLDQNKKVILSASVDQNLQTFGFKIPEKYKGGAVYLKVYGKNGETYDVFSYEINDPLIAKVEVGTPTNAAIQFNGDKDSFTLVDTTGFESLQTTGAGEWRVQIESATSTDLSKLSAKIGKGSGVLPETFSVENGKLVADIARTSAGKIPKGFSLEVSTNKGVTIGSSDINYTVSLLSDDYASNKQTTATLDLNEENNTPLNGKFAWVGDIDWVKLVVSAITNKANGDTYAITGLASSADFKLFDASGKKGTVVTDNQLNFTKTGTYYLQVSDDAQAAGSNWALDINLVGVTDVPTT